VHAVELDLKPQSLKQPVSDIQSEERKESKENKSVLILGTPYAGESNELESTPHFFHPSSIKEEKRYQEEVAEASEQR